MVQKLGQMDWFLAVGHRDMPGVVLVESWLEAAAAFASREWQNIKLDGLNLLRAKVHAQSEARYREWNEKVKELKPVLDELIKRKTETVVREQKLPIQFIHSVYANLLGAAMEAEFSDLVAPGFFTNVILDSFLRGHFPCGWDGEFPQGKPIVF